MTVGIVTRYYNHEATYVALRIADWFSLRGDDVELFACAKQQRRLGCSWDDRVDFAGPRGFTKWARRHETIVWTHPPAPEQLTWAKRHRIRTIIVPLWLELRSEHRRSLKKADYVLAPSRSTYALLCARWKLKNCAPAVWDPGLPSMCKAALRAPGLICIVAPLFEEPSTAEDVEGVFDLISRTLRECPLASMTVLFCTSRWQPRNARRLRRLSTKWGDRLRVMSKATLTQRPLLYHQHDLLVWCGPHESTGMTCLASLAVGTPVIAFAAPVLDEFLTPDNSIQVPAKLEFSRLGIPSLIPNYVDFGDMLCQVARAPECVAKLQTGTMKLLDARRKCFSEAWQSVCT